MQIINTASNKTNKSLKKYKALITNLTICIYINTINDWVVLKIKDRYKLELQMLETMKLFGSTKKKKEKEKKNRQNKEWESVPSLK